MEQPSPVGTPFGRSESQRLRTLTSKDPEWKKNSDHVKSVVQANP